MSSYNRCPIPKYIGLYWIDSAGNVVNRSGHYMKPIKTNRGYAVELRKNGQREKILIEDLLMQAGILESRDENLRSVHNNN